MNNNLFDKVQWNITLDDTVGDVKGCVSDSTENLTLKSFFDGYIWVTGSTAQMNSLNPDGFKNAVVKQDLVCQGEFRFPVSDPIHLL